MFYLKLSRPGLWFATLWLYLLPTSNQPELFSEFSFWFGFFYVCFPLNFLIYSWNDSVDIATDLHNPRKDSFWFGARGSTKQLAKIWKPNLVIQGICLPILIYFGGFQLIIIISAFIGINFLYNLPKNGLRSKPPLELACQAGYLLIVPLSITINNLHSLSLFAYIYLFLFAIQSHLMGEVMDIIPDKASNRNTTATILGVIKTKLLIILIVLLEITLLLYYFNEYLFTAVLCFGLLWLLVDLFWIFKNKNYTLKQMKLFAYSSNIIAFVTIIYVWLSGCLILK